MPPKTRGVRVLKASKENIGVLVRNKVETVGKSSKPARRPLADKTNSASDENTTPEAQKKVVKTSTKTSRKVVSKVVDEERPRRNRRLPARYVENLALNNLSNSKETPVTPNKSGGKTPVKNTSKVQSPFKTPNNVLENSLVLNRQRRVSRLPSKFDETVSPDKFVPIQPCHTSTPLVPNPRNQPKKVENVPVNKQKRIPPKRNLQKKVTPQQKKVAPQKVSPEKVRHQKVTPKKVIPEKKTGKKFVQKKISEVVNMTIRQDRVKRLRKPVEYKEVTPSPKLKSPVNSKSKYTAGKIVAQVNSSFRVFEEKKAEKVDGRDVYEFTFDPSEEPQKKKRKKATIKKPSQPKPKFYKNNYEKNLARALADLKKVVAKQNQTNVETCSSVTKPVATTAGNKPTQDVIVTVACSKSAPIPTPSSVIISTTADVHSNPVNDKANYSSGINDVSTKNHASIRVEDIAADFEATIDHHDDINYSPANTPERIEIEPDTAKHVSPAKDTVRSDDPLNLRNDLSFFDNQPVANSSMNMSSRNPLATPWRVEFERLPIKWQANTYVKPDMTPALESSYINNFNDSKKKHVYTNMVEQADEIIPEIIESDAPKLKQTSIISFIKEVVERNANKKKKVGQGTPTKANSLFDASNASINTAKDNTQSKKTSGDSNNTSSENDASIEGNKAPKRKNEGDTNPTPVKVARKDNENTFFGFDDSENQEQENISPVKVVNSKRLRSLRTRSGAVLKELNKQTGPMRAAFPASMKSKLAPSSDVVEEIYGQMKSATDAPVFLDRQGDEVNTNITELPNNASDDEDSQSVHLFQDVELVHHLKPTRKSYGKSKKVNFTQNASDSGDETPVRNMSSDEDDLSFHLPEVKAKKPAKKKKNKKQMLSKKEKAEADAWAASFNSMCDDVEEFDLVVE